MANEPDLEPGRSSEWVAYLQQLLNHHYQQSVVPENGEFDDTTANAARHFRQQGGLGDGAGVDAHVWAALTGGGAAQPSAAGSGGGQHADAGAAHHGGGHHAAPQSGNGPTGLLNDSSIDSYVSHSYGATVSSMPADDRAQTLTAATEPAGPGRPRPGRHRPAYHDPLRPHQLRPALELQPGRLPGVRHDQTSHALSCR